MKTWTQTIACRSRAHCEQCLTARDFRLKIVAAGLAAGINFACPEGWRPGDQPPALRLRQTIVRVDRLTHNCCHETRP